MDEAQWCELFREGSLEVLGRMPWSSNATFLVLVRSESLELRAVYKPGRGERQLWDFPPDVYRREVAAYELSSQLGLSLVPETVVREDGLCAGSLQRFVDADYEEHYFTLVEDESCGDALRMMCAFDIVANNADRKGGHVLRDSDGAIWGVDQGLCFHEEDKLRTVIWDFTGEALPLAAIDACRRLIEEGPRRLDGLLNGEEIESIAWRAQRLLAAGEFPAPSDDYRSYPWPLV